MPISIHYDPEQNILYTDATGAISIDDIMSYYSEIEHMNLNPQYSVLADYSEASIELSYDDVKRMTSRRRKVSQGSDSVKIAVVAKSDVVFGVARMYEAMINDERFKVNAFRDREKAVQWLEISDIDRKTDHPQT